MVFHRFVNVKPRLNISVLSRSITIRLGRFGLMVIV
jgi:hypothetical protein